jgi:hypothetical protein
MRLSPEEMTTQSPQKSPAPIRRLVRRIFGLGADDTTHTVVEQPPRTPAVGETWQLESLVDPWGDRGLCKIIDVRDGWVRYSLGRLSPDNRKTMGDFVRMYLPPNARAELPGDNKEPQ